MSRREEDRAQRRQDFYQQKLDDSATSEEIAKTYYEVLCGYIRPMPEDDRDEAWTEITSALAPLVRRYTHGQVRTRSSQRRAAGSRHYAPSRARARARGPA